MEIPHDFVEEIDFNELQFLEVITSLLTSLFVNKQFVSYNTGGQTHSPSVWYSAVSVDRYDDVDSDCQSHHHPHLLQQDVL